MASDSELACTSALILAGDDVAITGEKITTILKAADFQIEPFWPSLFAHSVTGMNVKELISNIGAGAAPAAGGAAPAGEAAAEEKKEEKKEESEEESDDDMGFGLFD